MGTKLSNVDELHKALCECPGRPVELEDDETKTVYVILAREQFREIQLHVIALSDEENAGHCRSIVLRSHREHL